MNKTGTNNIGTLRDSAKKIIRLLLEFKEGMRAKLIIQITGLPRRTIYNNLIALQGKKLITHIPPIYKLCHSLGDSEKVAQLLKSSNIQLHDVSFVVRLGRKPLWWDKRRNTLTKLKAFHFDKEDRFRNNPYELLSKENFLIQSFSNSLIFINRQHYWGEDAYECFIKATTDFLNMLEFFEAQVQFRFFRGGVPQARIRSQHYVLIRNSVAKLCKKKGELFEIRVNNKLRMWIDLSEPFGEEAGHPDYAPEDMTRYKAHIGDVIEKLERPVSEIDSHTRLLDKGITATLERLDLFETKALNPLTTQLKLHLEVEEKQKDNLIKQSDQMDKSNKIMERMDKTLSKMAKFLEPRKAQRLEDVKTAYRQAFGGDYW